MNVAFLPSPPQAVWYAGPLPIRAFPAAAGFPIRRRPRGPVTAGDRDPVTTSAP